MPLVDPQGRTIAGMIDPAGRKIVGMMDPQGRTVLSTAPIVPVLFPTGSATRVGATGLSNIRRLASLNGTLYAVAIHNFRTYALYSINTTTGAATQVGSSTRFGIARRIRRD